jgi:hypothetical protein
MAEPIPVDDAFYDRADSFIRLANEHSEKTPLGKTSASFMFGLSRFNAWVVASSCDSRKAMAKEREHALGYFVAEFRKMLEQNLDDYLENFDDYMRPDDGTK